MIARGDDVLLAAQQFGARLKKAGVHEWTGPCPKCGGTDRFAVNTAKGVFNCRGCDVGGDAIKLVRHLNGCGFREALSFLNLDTFHPPKLGATIPKLAESDPRVARIIADIIREMRPVRGTRGERYLHEIRCIDTDPIADVLERSDAIGWHPAVYFNNRDHPLNGQRLGCIVGVMTDPVTAMPTGAISRTYVGSNLHKIGKAKTLGVAAGILRLTPDEDHALCLAEGLETALSAMAKEFVPSGRRARPRS